MLCAQVVLHLYQEAVEKVPFFSGRNPHFITSVVTYLRLEYYSPVCPQGSQPFITGLQTVLLV
jgi:hypothetical protein